MKRLIPALVSAAAMAAPGAALAWGSSGHRMVGELGVKALPSEIPAFLRTPQAVLDVGELSREPDRSKSAGRTHDTDRDAAHFLDLGDDGKIFGGLTLGSLPLTRAEYETALRAVGSDSWKAGYLPYSIIDRYQQLTIDFAYWRVLDAAIRNPKWKAHRAWFTADKRRREMLILVNMGQLSHFVGDGSQPLHVTIHFNGWGDAPNPGGFTTAKIHSPFESDLVRASVKPADVTPQMTPFKSCNCAIEQRTQAYLAATGALVVPLYQLEKAGGLASGDPRGPAFASKQLAVGASELRDLTVEAWRASLKRQVGWRPVSVEDVVAGKVDPYPALYGTD